MRFHTTAWKLLVASLAGAGAAGCGEGAGAPPDDFKGGDVTVGTGSAASGGAGTTAGAGGAGTSGGSGSAAGGTGSGGAGSTGSSGSGGGAPPSSVTVALVPQAGVSGAQRVNFAVPLAPGQLTEASEIKVSHQGAEVAAARRVLARYPDQSARSVQVQIDLAIAGETEVVIDVGEPAAAGDLDLVPVEDTLVDAGGESGPRVWALLPAKWLSDSGVAGPEVPEADVAGTALAAWSQVCDYAEWGIDGFLAEQSDGAVWLYDRGTVMYRGYARRGDLVPLEAAYRETSIYRNGAGGGGIAVPGKGGDLKYYYAQNMAIHYLLSGDDRFRESAEEMGDAVQDLWGSPGYSGGSDFWTERHAGFGLLAYVWIATVSDDRAAEFAALADAAVGAYLDVQATYPPGYGDADARCFAHTADAHGEPFGSWGCSPWMSAILADGLDAYATLRGGPDADAARESIVKLGRILAREGRDGDGRPFYWMGVGPGGDEPDPYEEHWGETAYIVAMAWHHDGRRDAELEQAAGELVQGFADHGEAGQIRSFNWQCRSAVATPYYLQP